MCLSVSGPLPSYFFVWGGTAIPIVGPESGQIHSVQYNSCRCSAHNPIPPCYTLYRLYRQYLFTHGGVGGGELERR
jgi:hypothetical protein